MGIEQDVAFITTANPSSTLKLIETGRRHCNQLLRDLHEGRCRPPGGGDLTDRLQRRFRPNPAFARRLQRAIDRDQTLRPGQFWNLSFLANWTGGTLGLYLPRLRKVFGDIPIRDIGLLASEGRFTIPLGDNRPFGPADITSAFLEFIPADRRGEDDPPTLRAHELEVGGEYFLVFSNWTALLRYNLDDRVRVVQRMGDCPVLEFLCRGVRTTSMTGEKLTEKQVVEAMDRLADKGFGAIERFQVQGCFQQEPYYRLTIEPTQGDSRALAEAFDACLCRLNIEYASKRRSGRLGPVRLRTVETGFFERNEAQAPQVRKGRREQYKHTYLLTEILSPAGQSRP
jgi:hypothetical protein